MMVKGFLLKSSNVLIEGKRKEASLFISNGIIEEILDGRVSSEQYKEFDFGENVIMPGLIDSHVHINEPGRTDWEGFDTACKAAAAGGITTMIDMPLNSTPVTTSIKAFDQKLKAASLHCHVNLGFWAGLIPQNKSHLDDLLSAGVFGTKIFLTHSGIDDFPNVTKNDILDVISILQNHNLPLLAHCELDEDHEGIKILDENPGSYDAYLKSRPKVWEDNAIKLMLEVLERSNIPVHIVHLSSANLLQELELKKKEYPQLSIETCPHYVCFDAEDIPDSATQYKCAPPIREKDNNDKLWSALKSGIIDFVVSDHSPAPPELKKIESGNFKEAWGGIASLQCGLPAFWTKASENGLSIEKCVQLMSSNVARFLSLDQRKGHIRKGYDADICVWNPEEEFTITLNNLHHKHKVCPYLGQKLKGKVKATFVNGKLVYHQDSFVSLHSGELLTRTNEYKK